MKKPQKNIEKETYPSISGLSEVEKVVLNGLASGLDILEIELKIRLTCSDDTYHTVLQSLLQKFNARNEPNLAYKAVLAGIIDIKNINN